MDDREFADTLTMCQFMPGPNIVGITVCVGSRLRGSIGAITACRGFHPGAVVVGMSLGGLYYAHITVLQNILSGLSAAAAGLMIATGLRLLLAHRGRRTALLFAVLDFAGMALTKLPLLAVLLGLAPISFAVAGFRDARVV
jgi:chromate transporter